MAEEKKKDLIEVVELGAERRKYAGRIVGAVFIYFCILFGLIICVRELELRSGTTSFVLDVYWNHLINFAYYGVPFIVALFFGIKYRPFWPNFRNILFAIFMIHLTYSITVYTLRYPFADAHWKEIYNSEAGEMSVTYFTHRFYDDSKDGLIDRVIFHAGFNLSSLHPGRYILDVYLSQRGRLLKEGEIGRIKFNVKKGISKPIKRKFVMDPQKYKQYFDRGPIDVNIGLRKVIVVGREAKKALFLSRWAAFLKSTSWEGSDRMIYDTVLDIQKIKKVDTFSLIPLRFQRKKVFFREFMGDFGRDRNSNGLFEEIVISMEVYSDYEGPIFITGTLDGDKKVPLLTMFPLKKGFNKVDFVIKGELFKKHAMEGPYNISNFKFTNIDPSCEGESCPKQIKAYFTEFLDEYQTEYYSHDQFE